MSGMVKLTWESNVLGNPMYQESNVLESNVFFGQESKVSAEILCPTTHKMVVHRGLSVTYSTPCTVRIFKLD